MVFETGVLLKQAQEGDGVALGALLEHYRPYLLVLAHRYLDGRLQGRMDPADLVQVTFLEAHRDFRSFRGQDVSSVLAWLRNILRNNVASAHQRHLMAEKRSAKREVEIIGPTSSTENLGLAGLIPSETTSPSQRIMRDEAAARLAICVQRLPGAQAEAIRLRYMEGCTLKGIADRMGKSEMAVAGLLKRGLRALRLDILNESSAG
jgi:RNA polymerase sigma-70 factor (ECF subfamily)